MINVSTKPADQQSLYVELTSLLPHKTEFYLHKQHNGVWLLPTVFFNLPVKIAVAVKPLMQCIIFAILCILYLVYNLIYDFSNCWQLQAGWTVFEIPS